MIKDPDEFFAKGCGRCDRFATAACSARQWADGLARLRALCLELGLEETAKWGHPCYMHAGRNVVLIGALREEFRLNFFHAALMKDPKRILEKQGANTQHADSLRFTDAREVTKLAPTIRAYIKEAMGYAATGTKPPKTQAALALPEELSAALAKDAELAAAFEQLTPGRKRSYVINLNGAKTTATRQMRIAKFRNHILAGKGALER